MTTTDDTADAPVPDGAPRRARPGRRLVAAAVGVGVVLALLAAGRWWTSPDLFPDSGAGMTLDPRPLERAAMTVGVTAPHAEGQAERTGLTFTDTAEVELSRNTAKATVDVAVCRARPGADPIGVVPRGDVGEFCDELVPVGGGVRMSQGPWAARERDYVVVTLTPTRPGKVRLAGVSLSYRTDRSQFYRRGTDTISLDLSVFAR